MILHRSGYSLGCEGCVLVIGPTESEALQPSHLPSIPFFVCSATHVHTSSLTVTDEQQSHACSRLLLHVPCIRVVHSYHDDGPIAIAALQGSAIATPSERARVSLCVYPIV